MKEENKKGCYPPEEHKQHAFFLWKFLATVVTEVCIIELNECSIRDNESMRKERTFTDRSQKG